MATAAEMKAFQDDQRHLTFATIAGAVDCACKHYAFSEGDKALLENLQSNSSHVLSINWMFSDEQHRLIWLRADQEREQTIKLTYLESEWPSDPPVLSH